ncbi:hypothetical protein PTSG_02232 [Salpingoeca rosetta]|uniref:MGAT4 conserved region domain-containing protein n=1 Tax=Salpingoeca rosetta (strain ATCC 50818 / BSB-021) TaxID=946362 RepID=F2U1L2_SALR5|nr:uncharacterized protein PTSG_02232 [Salpingoeca rosetta]EGD81514.1 hypothetical protein PTSG_02232 [Salpingoeca rosetta]|eukprot:XP_004996718.1 hypothetical protein PTSG_02232 [Salpingoeca rosetta]
MMRGSGRRVGALLALGAIVVVGCSVLLWTGLTSEDGACPRPTSVQDVLRCMDLSDHVTVGSLPSSKRKLAIGIPSVWRSGIKKRYITDTLHSLLDVPERHLLKDIVVVILAADRDPLLREKLKLTIATEFSHHVHASRIIVIEVPDAYYPQLYHKRNDYEDSQARTIWRQKQCVDYSFLMAFSARLASTYLQLEDDVSATRHYLPALNAFVDAFPQAVMLEFSTLGFIGKAFPSADLPALAHLFHTFYADAPVDLLLQYYIAIQNRKNDVRQRQPPLFQHVGTRSSLSGKRQTAVEPNYELEYDLKRWRADNPPAEVTSSMTPAFSSLPIDAYLRAPGGFWAAAVQDGDDLTIAFTRPARVIHIRVRTGTKEHNSADRLQAGELHVLFEGSTRSTILAAFDKGIAEAAVSHKRRVSQVKIISRAIHTTWVMIQEIAVLVHSS